MKFLLSLIRLILIFFSLTLISFSPSSAFEIKMFFVARFVFFAMLVVDYMNVIYFNSRLERYIGVAGLIVTGIITGIDAAGVFDIISLKQVDKTWYIDGNASNFLTSDISKFKAHTYVFVSFISLAAILGVEVLNHGFRGLMSTKVQQDTKAA